MCMVSGEVESISDTNILVSKIMRKETSKAYQLTVYSNKVVTQNPVAMILPFPNANMDPVIIKTTKNDNNIYKIIDNMCFPKPKTRGFSLSNNSSYNNDSDSTLKVYRSGSYRYSIVNKVGDLNRVDKDVFQIKSDLQILLNEYANKNFGFIVCIIDKDVDYTPFAYITDLIDNEFFIPTKHYHEHSNPFLRHNVQSELEEWDHSIYVIGSHEGNASEDFNVSDTNYSFSKYLVQSASCKKENVLRIKQKGLFYNKDFIVSCV